MIVVDTSALVVIYQREAEADAFLNLLDGSPRCLISAVNVVETMSVLCGQRIRARRDHVERLIAFLNLEIVPVDPSQMEGAIDALLAFGKGRHPAGLNFGDCFPYALAKSLGAPLLFKGDDFARTDILPAWRP